MGGGLLRRGVLTLIHLRNLILRRDDFAGHLVALGIRLQLAELDLHHEARLVHGVGHLQQVPYLLPASHLFLDQLFLGVHLDGLEVGVQHVEGSVQADVPHLEAWALDEPEEVVPLAEEDVSELLDVIELVPEQLARVGHRAHLDAETDGDQLVQHLWLGDERNSIELVDKPHQLGDGLPHELFVLGRSGCKGVEGGLDQSRTWVGDLVVVVFVGDGQQPREARLGDVVADDGRFESSTQMGRRWCLRDLKMVELVGNAVSLDVLQLDRSRSVGINGQHVGLKVPLGLVDGACLAGQVRKEDKVVQGPLCRRQVLALEPDGHFCRVIHGS